MKHFINLDDLSNNDLTQIIDQAIALKKQHKSGAINNTLENKTLAMIFDKSSTRTRVSFEAGMAQLGGHALFLSDRDIQLGRGEPIVDSAIVIGSMVDAIVMRVSSHESIDTFSQNANAPIINALSDESHPCQLLADMMTYKEHKGDIQGKTVAWIGDGNNMCHTYMQAAKAFGFKLNIATPKNYQPDPVFVEKYAHYIHLFTNAQDACQAVDLVVTDVWASMGQESEQNMREIAFKDFQVNDKLLAHAKSDVAFMHCLPAHRGEEVSASVIDGSQSLVWDEAENRLHAQKALLLYLINT
ncbi:Ornithine carbamoyltransferase [Bathymodiolus thermophilus thioautotrophic gill symbiont]|uniref:Ornithine carbamoyltransferase n=1 Tax=Bathymodiolus thermophilus thioautotrophic gill symbiont TaxID=2360 RepID=A0A1J5U8N9_9GAMM|nr:ornithine carbamoyltransferase [Bathymodiolus thermophilus thioautotrophic gill symbiont]AYQ56609.1 Ornithine carbamoyltransferase [Bathymodiolus thermophilus thioautotrophic gill symbiont]OIR24745.1 ornithine carbamoyltransferase [Bathymodiolus thermophilus thioautotrophic gill symbiont]CAB5497822.1 Ornithine carbamoyltransferase (EC [Bathymodiolus thermophilus thioautotrophic gill symbiont]SHA18259.1 Ornithine carbamoyltransferase [Bathymodiolus thermophilus thioautotrophic gill symbiont]